MVTEQVPSVICLLTMPLFHIYRKISTNQLKENYDNVATITYDVLEPIDAIFRAVDDLSKTT